MPGLSKSIAQCQPIKKYWLLTKHNVLDLPAAWQLSCVNCPLPNPPPQAGEGTITLSPACGRELERGFSQLTGREISALEQLKMELE